MFRTSADYVVLACVSATVCLLFLGGAPLWDRDEPRNAGCAVEMMTRGDWVTPVFNAELRTHKPALLYWLMIAAYSVFGVDEFAARLSSALLGVATVLLTYAIGCRLFNRGVGFWGGLILATTIMFGVASRAATPDSLLIFCSTAAMGIFVFATFPCVRASDAPSPHAVLSNEEPPQWPLFPRSHIAVLAMYATMGLAVLAKGPVGVVLPTAVLGMYLLWMRMPPAASVAASSWRQQGYRALRLLAPRHFLRTCWAMRPLTAMAVVTAVALPWYSWVHLRSDGVWTREFFWTHNVSRATAPMEGHSGPPVLFYLAAILVGCFPWSVFAIPASLCVGRLARDRRESPVRSAAIVLLTCWVGVYVVLFSFAATKLPSYITPCYPAIALLLGIFVDRWTDELPAGTGWLKLGFANLMVVGVLLAVGLPLAAHRFLPGSEWLGLLGVIPLMGGLLAWQKLRENPHRALVTVAVTAVSFSVFLQAIVPREIGRHQEYARLLRTTRGHAGPVVALGHLEPSWIFYGGRPLREFTPGEAKEFWSFLDEHPQTLVLTTAGRLEDLQGAAPAGSFRCVDSAAYFLRDRKLLLVQRNLPDELPVARASAAVSGMPAHRTY